MKSSHKIALALVISFIISGIADSYFLHSQNIEAVSFLPHTLVLAVLLFSWCRNHAQENNIQNVGYKPLFCAVIGPVGVTYYAFKCYGFKSGILLITKCLLSLMLAVVLYGGIDYLFSLIYV
ncbi:hypothetical protein [Vibrio genomosp. F10]|uniref:hypothetical protein n=1 Tax=Vibrio genomosp. F10 TaxID=723171 RepID=UPI00037ECA9B|nr:hypothetical protein [Vibrio genomosp. F10]OEE84597.1 hypothetical protein A1QK_20185 [Vibrio genomosp. F10 str. 9ZD137]